MAGNDKSLKVKLHDVRLSFPNLFEAQRDNEGKNPKFGASFIMAPEHAGVKAIKDAIKAAALAKWGPEKYVAVLKNLKANNKLCIKDGNTKDYDGYEGNMYVSASNRSKPSVFTAGKKPLAEQSEGAPYSGCYVNAVIEVWAMDNKYGKRVNASLSGVQFLRDGDSFGGGTVDCEDDFDALESGSAEDLPTKEEDIL